jgi:hypothetical protein
VCADGFVVTLIYTLIIILAIAKRLVTIDHGMMMALFWIPPKGLSKSTKVPVRIACVVVSIESGHLRNVCLKTYGNQVGLYIFQRLLILFGAAAGYRLASSKQCNILFSRVQTDHGAHPTPRAKDSVGSFIRSNTAGN